MSNDERYSLLKDQIDAVRTRLDEEAKPRYKNVSVLISLLALVFSFGTTVISLINSHKEDIRANRRDVRAIIQRLTKLPIENYDLMQKNKGTGQGEALSGMLNQENILLSTQASELVERYPNTFSSTEYFAIASALASSNIIGKVPKFFQQAMDEAKTSNDYNVAARAYGGYLYSKGDYTEGRKLFETALRVWDKFSERNMYIVNSYDLVTLMYWSQAEYSVGNRQEAKEHLAEARKKLGALASGPYTDSLKNQLEYTSKFVDQ